jgi:hypothetical protein
MNTTKPTDTFTATLSFRLTEDECRTLALRADRGQRALAVCADLAARRAVAHVVSIVYGRWSPAPSLDPGTLNTMKDVNR